MVAIAAGFRCLGLFLLQLAMLFYEVLLISFRLFVLLGEARMGVGLS